MRFVRETVHYARYEGELNNGKTWYVYVPKPLVKYYADTPLIWPAEIDMFVGTTLLPRVLSPCPPVVSVDIKSPKSRRQYVRRKSTTKLVCDHGLASGCRIVSCKGYRNTPPTENRRKKVTK
jgi:hypothetical protein